MIQTSNMYCCALHGKNKNSLGEPLPAPGTEHCVISVAPDGTLSEVYVSFDK